MVLLYVLLLTLGQTLAQKEGPEQKYNETFDFVIVGAGTAGCVLANRLTEVQNWTVLLLEAGDYPGYFTKIPALSPLWYNSTFNWNYLTEPQQNIFKGLKNGRMRYSSGKTVGGTSAINYLIYSRGNKADYNKWGEIYPEWSYDKVMPYFLKSEGSHLDFGDLKYHNFTGPLNIEHAYIEDSGTWFLQAANELGYKMTDYNGNNQLGFSQIQTNQNYGTRWGSYEAFLKPALSRPNLKVLTSAKALRIIINQNKIASGVKFLRNGTKYRVTSNKATIICAGTFNTPKLLLSSGVGPRKDLEELKINVTLDLPAVGQNLQDHVAYIGLNFENTVNTTKYDLLGNFLSNIPHWFTTGRGILTTTSGFQALGYAKLSQSPAEQNYPDIELIHLNSMLISNTKLMNNFKDDVFDELYRNESIKWSIYPILLHPKSKGYIKLGGKNHTIPPKIFPNFLEDPEDLAKMISGIKLVLKFLEAPVLKRVQTRLNQHLVPGCKQLSGDLYWECALKALTVTSNDPFGTCSMGKDGVVDQRFRVNGIKKLRIVDASTIPVSISGHLGAVVVMIAERAANFMKTEYSQ